MRTGGVSEENLAHAEKCQLVLTVYNPTQELVEQSLFTQQSLPIAYGGDELEFQLELMKKNHI